MPVDGRAKLAEKGLTLPVAAKPVAAYLPATYPINLKIVRMKPLRQPNTAEKTRAAAIIMSVSIKFLSLNTFRLVLLTQLQI